MPEFTVSGGTLTVEPVAAQDQSAHRNTWVEPAARVHGTMKVRGITYTIDVTHRWLEDARPVYVNGRETNAQTHWQQYIPTGGYNYTDGGYRRVDSGKQADSGSYANKAIDAMVRDALDQFTATDPDWRTQSFRLRLEHMIARELREADHHQRQANEHTTKATALQTKLNDLYDA